MRSPSIDYDLHAPAYPAQRRADLRIAARVHAALGDARSVLNVGAGCGSYEPQDRDVLAVEPSAGMRAQRAPHLAPAIDASAEALPLDEGSFDAAMAMATIHHWRDPAAGLRELARVSRQRVVVLTFDPDVLADFWLFRDYVPQALADDQIRFPSIEQIVNALGGEVSVEPIPIPVDCTDGFLEAFYARPEAVLDPSVRAAQSVWPRLAEGVEKRAMAALRADLSSGAWEQLYGHLRGLPTYDGTLRLVVSRTASGLI
ncbi:MAG: methyltransferase domain-containing protein [Solirubrobacteraceae bacterium]